MSPRRNQLRKPSHMTPVVFHVTLVLSLLASCRSFQDSSTCGEQTMPLAGEIFIIGGRPAQEGEWPWAGRLFVDGTWVCGGSLVHPQWILTAGHCLIGILTRPDLFTFSMGNNKVFENSVYEQTRTAEKIFMHPGYKIGEIAADPGDDLALLKLKEPFIITDHVRTVCLPTADMTGEFPGGTAVTVVGWGQDDVYDRKSTSSELQKISLSLVDQETCKSKWKGIEPVDDDMLCAGTTTKTICQGDSGGPLMAKNNDRWFEIGVVSFTSAPYCNLLPSVFMRITSYEDWITPIYDGADPTGQTSNCSSRGMYTCRHGGCVSHRFKCDKEAYQCYQGSDEEYCGEYSIQFDAFYDTRLAKSSVVHSKNVGQVEDCAELCLSWTKDDKECVAFDMSLTGNLCQLAVGGFSVVPKETSSTVLHFERDPLYQKGGLSSTAKILIIVGCSVGGVLILVVVGCGVWFSKKNSKRNVPQDSGVVNPGFN